MSLRTLIIFLQISSLRVRRKITREKVLSDVAHAAEAAEAAILPKLVFLVVKLKWLLAGVFLITFHSKYQNLHWTQMRQRHDILSTWRYAERKEFLRRHDTQHNDTLHNNIQQNDTMRNDIHHNIKWNATLRIMTVSINKMWHSAEWQSA